MEQINPLPSQTKKGKKLHSVIWPLWILFPFVNVVVNGMSVVQLWRLFSKGLVKEYKNLLLFFIFFTTSQFFVTFNFFKDLPNVLISNLAKDNGVAGILIIVFQLLACIFLTIWVVNYLRFRIYPLLITGISALVIIVSIFSAFIYSVFILTNTEADFLQQLNVNVDTINYSVKQMKDNALGIANLLKSNPNVTNAFYNNDTRSLTDLTKTYASTVKELDYIAFLDQSGVVISHSNDANKVGSSLSTEVLVNRALNYKEANASLTLVEDVLAPTVIIEAVSPILKNDKVVGVCEVAFILDNAYADKIKAETGLDIIIYGNKVRSATTFTASDGVSRMVNLPETDPQVLTTVFDQGTTYKGSVDLDNTPYYGVYLPIRDAKTNIIGMIFAGRAKQILLDTAKQANRQVFVITTLISCLAIIPAVGLASFIYKNYRA
jgi:hypothetical protein